jgi:hypothetical protein
MTMHRFLLAVAALATVPACDRVVDLISTTDASPYVIDAGGYDGEVFPGDGYAGAIDTGFRLDGSFAVPDAPAAPSDASLAVPSPGVRTGT